MTRRSAPKAALTRATASRASRQLAPLAFALVSCSCSGRVSPPEAPAVAQRSANEAPQSGAERFLPLRDDTVFRYAVWLPESPEPEQLILQVDRRRPARASLRSGSSVKRLEFVPDGVRLVTGGYLLKAPLALGASWSGPAGRVQVTALEQNVSVPAGTFVGCLETTETSGQRAAARAIVTTYCPDVGIVRFSVDDGERRERFELESFGPHVRIESLTD